MAGAPCMTKCVKNSQCSSGNCDFYSKRCKALSSTLEPCKSDASCSGGQSCDGYLRKCTSVPGVWEKPCSRNSTCPTDKYCVNGSCIARLGLRSACKENDDCQDGLGCLSGVCMERCEPGAYECTSGMSCRSSYCEPSMTPTHIALISIGSIIFVALLIGLVVFLVLRSKRKSKVSPPPPRPIFQMPQPPMIYTPTIQPSPIQQVYVTPSAPNYPPSSPSAPDAPPPSYEHHAGSSSSSGYSRSEKQ